VVQVLSLVLPVHPDLRLVDSARADLVVVHQEQLQKFPATP
jgi:hypothetical protein